jgi:hypothetical protein
MRPRIPTTPARAFLCLGSVFGVIFLFVTPPFQSPDEDAHFYRAFQISEGTLTAGKIGESTGGSIPRSVQSAGSLHSEVRHNPHLKVSLAAVVDGLDDPLAPADRVDAAFPNTANFSPVAYAPQGAAIFSGRLFGAAPLVLMYLGRIANLAAWLALVFYAIRLAPVGGWLLAILALSPMSMFLAPTLSADALTNGLAFLWIALFLSAVAREDRLDAARVSSMAVVTVALTLSKQPYGLLVLLLLAVPVARWGSRRAWSLGTAGLVGVNLLAGGVWAWIANRSWSPARVDVPIAPGEQLAYVIGHPVEFLRTMYESHIGTRHLEEFVGVLGWLDTHLPVWLLSFQLFLVAAAILCAKRLRGPVTSWTVAGVLGVGIAVVVLIDLALYASWTPVGSSPIEGIQGRYYIPVSPLLVFLGTVLPFDFTEARPLHRFFFWGVTGVLLTTVAVLVDRYYLA